MVAQYLIAEEKETVALAHLFIPHNVVEVNVGLGLFRCFFSGNALT